MAYNRLHCFEILFHTVHMRTYLVRHKSAVTNGGQRNGSLQVDRPIGQEEIPTILKHVQEIGVRVRRFAWSFVL